MFKPLDSGCYSVYRPANHVWWGTHLGAITARTSGEAGNSVSSEQYINIKGMERVNLDVEVCDAGTGFNRTVMLVRVHRTSNGASFEHFIHEEKKNSAFKTLE